MADAATSELHSGSPRLHGLGGKLGGTSKWNNLGVALKWSAAANKPSSDVSSESRRNWKGAGGYSGRRVERGRLHSAWFGWLTMQAY